jgi:hypothetical protein
MAVFDRVKLRPTLILDRQELSPQDLARLRTSLELACPDPWGRVLELELGGVVVARGRLLRRGKSTWFKVGEILGGEA